MLHRIIAGAVLALLQSGCYQGYKPADELEDDERGPSACSQSCQELGMHMSAFVLVGRGTSGCVCSPNPGPGQAPQAELEGGPAAGAGAGAAYATIQAERAAQQAQAQAQTSAPK